MTDIIRELLLVKGIAAFMLRLRTPGTVSTFKRETGQISVDFQCRTQRDLPGALSLCYAMVFMSLSYTESWKTGLSVPFLSQAETATRLLLLLVVDFPGAVQFLQICLRRLSSPQFLWLSMTAGMSSEQYGPLGILGLIIAIHCAWERQFLHCHDEGPGKKMLICGKIFNRP